MRVWAVLRLASNSRFVLPVLVALRRRGHDVCVSLAVSSGDDARVIEAAFEDLPGLNVEPLDLTERNRFWAWYAQRVLLPAREIRSYLRQSQHWVPVLHTRWENFLPRPLRIIPRLARLPLLGQILRSRVILRGLDALESVYPGPAGLSLQLRRLSPDVVLVTPMIYPMSREIDAVRTARQAGVATVGLVLSWDNLSSKGDFHSRPDRLLVWNDIQGREAVKYHGFEERRIEVIGAPVFDYLFTADLSVARADFLRRFDIDSQRPYVLYAVSSGIAPGPQREVEIVRRLLSAFRDLSPDERPIVVVRPHPKNTSGWEALADPDLRFMEPGFPDSATERRSLYNGIVHASAVIGVNTSLFLEAAILGTPCITLRFPSGHPAAAASSFVHFSYLLEAGFLHQAPDEKTAAAILESLLDGYDPHAELRRSFVGTFVRPHGLTTPASEVAADRILASTQRTA
jgi:hypothetical protein